MIQVQGTLTAPEVDSSHQEPQSPVVLTAPLKPGEFRPITVGHFTNTGNVQQTASVTVTNLVNCTLDSAKFENGEASVTLGLGAASTLVVTVAGVEVPPGNDQTFSFDIEPVWA